MSNIFEQFSEYQSRKVGHPEYKPLEQKVEVPKTKEEINREKRNEYHKEYYRKNKERLRAQQREYWRKNHVNWNHKGDMVWNQKRVYEFLLDQYRKWEDPARWTEIAKALWISDNSVYAAVFQLTKRGYLGRWTYWRYLLLKFPEGEKIINESQEENDSEMVYVNEKDYDGLIEMNNKLKNENMDLQKKVDELRESNTALLQERDGKTSSLNYEIRDLRNELTKKTEELNELKNAVKILLKHFQ